MNEDPQTAEQVSVLLERLHAGDRGALDELLPLVYNELRRIARGQRQRLGGRQLTVNTTALVHEAYLRLARSKVRSFTDRGHFFAVAATAMRQLLIDEAKKHSAQKRGSGVRPISLDKVEVGIEEEAESLLALDRALTRLGEMSPRLLQVVECRFFGGLTEQETAEALAVTDRTVRRDWVKARAWLAVEMGAEEAAGLSP
ncbi:MAG TPA: ECF-type sigma factor [Thermoanaerobaculia bacterium]|nr:ECF-type sigma factor [Thermoanaerobaculia bacterium]